MNIVFWAVAAATVVVVLAALIIVFARLSIRARDTDDASPVVRTTFFVASAWTVVAALGAVITAIAVLVQPQVQIVVPTREYWPTLPAGTFVEGMTATRVGGGFTSADVLAGGLSIGVRICWALSQGLWWMLPAAVAALVALACSHLLKGQAFAPIVSRMAMLTAVVVAAGGTLAQILGDIAGSLASTELFEYSAAGYEEVTGIEDVIGAWWPQATMSVTLPFWPIAAGLAFASLAAIFRYGSKLHQDTEGLV